MHKPHQINRAFADKALTFASTPSTTVITALPAELRAKLADTNTNCTGYKELADRKNISFRTKQGEIFSFSLKNEAENFNVEYTGAPVKRNQGRKVGAVTEQAITQHSLPAQDSLVRDVLEPKWNLFAKQKQEVHIDPKAEKK